MRVWLVAVVWALAAAPGWAPGWAQGVQCGRARTPVEQALCASPALLTLDRETAAAFAGAMAREPGRQEVLRREQGAWLRQRDAACAVPARALPECLRGQLTSRIAALSPPVARPVTEALQIDPPPVAPVDPVIPAAVQKQAAARLERETLTPEAAETLLHVTGPGRFTLALRSPGGTALQLVDMLTGPSDPVGVAGAQDGRLDRLLDVGTYKLRAVFAKGAAGAAVASVVPFRDAAPPGAVPDAGRTVSATLGDGEQRAFWLLVPTSGQVRVEAAGRALADLRLWRDGWALSGLEPVQRRIEPVPGRALTDLRLVGQVEPGTYLVVAYGGPAVTWTDGDAAMPFHLRGGASEALQQGWAGGPVGPFGSEVFALPASTALLRLSLPEAAAAALAAGSGSAAIRRDSREPTAALAVVPGREAVAEVRAVAGQRFTLRALDAAGPVSWALSGTWFVSALAQGAGGDEPPPTPLLVLQPRPEPFGARSAPARIVADLLPVVGPGAGWRTRFNIRGTVRLLLRGTGGPVAWRTSGVTVEWSQGSVELPEGVYALELTPQAGALGALELVAGPPGREVAVSPALPPDPVVPLGVHRLEPGQQLRLHAGAAPGVRTGLSVRAVPVALAEGPLAVTLAAGASTRVPVAVAQGGSLSVTEVGAGAVEYRRDGEAVVVPAADHARTVVLAWRRTPVAAAVIPEPTAPGDAVSVQAGTPVFTDLVADAPRTFALTVEQGGLYRVETLGRLRTAGRLSTAFVPGLAAAEANGTGQNMLMQTMLRAGRYGVEVVARDSAGRAGLLASPAPLRTLPALRPGGRVGAALPAGTGAAVPVEIERAGVARFEVASLGRAWRGRLEDADGWPLTVPGPLDGIERTMAAGRYRLVVEPDAVDRQVAIRLQAVEVAGPVVGHGPHALPFGTVQRAVWREPEDRQAPRTPDRWTFGLEGAADVVLTLGDAMVGTLRREGAAPIVVVRRFEGRLEAGAYLLEVASLGRNDRAEYSLSLETAELQPGVPRQVTLPATVPFAIAADRVVSLTSFGSVPVRAVLRRDGRVLGRFGARAGDWNVAVSRPLPAGAYVVELLPAEPPWSLTTTARDDVPDADSRSDEEDDQAAQTASSLLVPAASRAEREEAGEQGTEIRLALPAELAAVAAPSVATVLAGRGVHVLALDPPPAGSLMVAQAEGAGVALVLERQGVGGWEAVAQDAGSAPLVAAPADGGAWRVRAWNLDAAADPPLVVARAVTSAGQAVGRVDLVALDGMAAPVGVALVRADPGVVRIEGEVLAGGWTGRGLAAVRGVVPQPGTLWLLGAPGHVTVEPVAFGAGSVALTVPAGEAVRLPGTDGVALWEARSGSGAPALGAGTGWAPGGAVALAGDGTVLRGGAEALRVDLSRHALTLAAEQDVDGTFHGVLPAGGALPLRLRAGDKTVELALAPGTAAVPDWRAGGGAVWAGAGALTRAVSGAWTELVLLNPGPVAAPVAVSVSPGAAPALVPGQVMRRFFGAAGSFEVAVRGGPEARLRLAGAGTLVLVGADGVAEGRDLALAGSGRAIVSHGGGAVALWVDAPGASPWPVVAPQPIEAPARVALAGEAMAFTLRAEAPVLLHVDTTAPVLLGVGEAVPALFAAGAAVDFVLAAGETTLRVMPVQDGPLSGTLVVRAAPIVAVAEGLGAPTVVAPGGAAAFGFTMARGATIGVGVRAEPDRVRVQLLTASGAVVGEGVAQLATVPAGSYVLAVQVPADAPTTVVRPALVGITPRGSGPPADVVRNYLELAGMKPQETSR